MKKCWLLIAAFFTFSAHAGDPVSLKILSYNINFGQLATVEELAAYIRSTEVDLAALQELDHTTYRPSVPHQNGVDILTGLAYHAHMMPVFGKSIDFAGGLYGLGILSKHSFLETQKFMLPHPEGAKEQRILLLTKVLLTSGDTVWFGNVHLDHSVSSVRLAQVNYLKQVLEKKKEQYPVLLCGDFNAEPDSPEIRLLSDWLMIGNDDFTFSTDRPHTRIDYIFLYPADRWNVKKYAVDRQIELSDHLPVRAELELIAK